MQELRFVAVSEDGSYAVLAVPGRSGRYILPIDERLRAVAQGQASRLAQYEIEVESPLRPKEIQARIRAGETAEEIADAAGIPVERVRWFEGPVLAERAYIADQAQAGSVRRAGDSSGPGPRLGDIVTARLSAAGTDPADGQWDSRKRGDGNWQVSLTFPSGGRLHVAEWVFDPRRRHVMPDDDNAARLSLPESELPAEPVPMPGEATVTPIASRLGAAAGMGGGSVGGPGVSRFRPERSVIPDRSLGIDRSLVERPAPPPVPASERAAAPDRPALSDRPAMPDRSAVPDRFPSPERPAPSSPVPPRPAQQDRADYQESADYQDRPANPGYAEFPESAPYRAPEPASEYRDPAPEPSAHRAQETGPHGYGDPASVPSAYRAQVPQPPAYREAAPEPRAYRDPVPEAAPYRAPSTQPPAYREPAPEPPGPAADVPAAAQVSPAPAFEHSERVRPTLPRPVIFENPEPTFLDDQPGPVQDLARPVMPPVSAPPTGPTDTSAAATPAPAAGAEVIAALDQSGAPVAAPSAETITPAEPATRAEQVTTAEPAAPAGAEPTDSTPEPAVPATPEVPALAEPAPAEDQSDRPRPGVKKNAKARRSSVPSWDEIMLGSSRQRD